MRTLLVGSIGLLGVIVAGYVLLCALLYFAQERSIFYPAGNDPELLRRLQASRVEIHSGEVVLEGWWVDNPGATTQAVVVYFGGNAEDVLYTASAAASIDARQVLVVNYRGYGRSTGQPGQRALYDDALAIYDYVIGSGVAPEHVVAMGRSLGSGVASMLAGSRPLAAAILVTPFDSLSAVAAHHYPLFPVRLLLKHPFPSTDWAQRARAPALILAAEHDYVVPAVHARRLYEGWPGSAGVSKEIHVLAGVGHNDIEAHPDYYGLINRFLAARVH